MKDGLLPVGSIVKIRFSKKKYMILGYYVGTMDKKDRYDYVAVEYPIGLTSLNDVAGFSEDYVKHVLHRGLETENSKKFLASLKAEVAKANKNNSAVKEQTINKLGE